MKNMTVANRRRWIAGCLYGLLCLYQLYLTKVLMEGTNLTNAYFTWLYAMAFVPIAGAVCVWMFSGRQALCENTRRGVVVATALLVVFELFTYSDQTDIINYTLYNMNPELVGNQTVLYLLMIIRLLLMILAAFFVVSAGEKTECLPQEGEVEEDDDAEKAEKEEAVSVSEDGSDDEAEAEVVEEVVVVVETEEEGDK